MPGSVRRTSTQRSSSLQLGRAMRSHLTVVDVVGRFMCTPDLRTRRVGWSADVMASMPGDAPIVVNSAGCGAAMKDYGHFIGSADAVAFSSRVLDVNEYLAERVDRLPPMASPRPTVIVQDPCHLRHVQRVVDPVRTLLGHVASVVELDDDGLCCGAGGAYSALQPDLAGQIRERKICFNRPCCQPQ